MSTWTSGNTLRPLYAMLNSILFVFALAAFCVSCISAPAQAVPQYRAVVLGQLAATPIDNTALAINNSGQIAGHSRDAATVLQAVTWDGGATPRVLGQVPGHTDQTRARATNAQGQIAGDAYNEGTGFVSFLYTEDSGMTTIGAPGSNTQATSVNDLGHVAGRSNGVSGYQAACIWTEQTGITLIMPELSDALAINNHDQVVGYRIVGEYDRAFLYNGPSSIVELGPLPGFKSSLATDINDNGDVIGTCQIGLPSRGFIWSQSGGMVDLGLPGWSTGLSPNSINVNRQIVGNCWLGSGGTHGFLWTEGQGVADLNTLLEAPIADGYFIGSAIDINDKGQILCAARQASTPYYTMAVLLNPVPEPSGLLALAGGLITIGGILCRRR